MTVNPYNHVSVNLQLSNVQQVGHSERYGYGVDIEYRHSFGHLTLGGDIGTNKMGDASPRFQTEGEAEQYSTDGQTLGYIAALVGRDFLGLGGNISVGAGPGRYNQWEDLTFVGDQGDLELEHHDDSGRTVVLLANALLYVPLPEGQWNGRGTGNIPQISFGMSAAYAVGSPNPVMAFFRIGFGGTFLSDSEQ